jgi:hypothetical protein
MTRTERLLFAALGALALFVGAEGYAAARSRPAASTESDGTVSTTPSRAPRSRTTAVAPARTAATLLTVDDVRRRLTVGAEGTYIGEILSGRDSALTRWPERTTRPLRVWVGSGDHLAGWDDAFAEQVRDAFASWEAVGIPLRFSFVGDSASADVHVSWVDRFNEPISGKTLWSRDDRWWIVDADISLALHHRDGDPLDVPQVRAIALHEIGHLLGLDHTVDATNIMAPKVRVRELSNADQATVRLLYSLPAGRVAGE